MNNCPQNAWCWEVRRNCNSIWPLLDTAGAACLSRSNPYTVFPIDYLFLCFLSHIKAHTNVYILPVLQSLGFSSCSWGDGEGDLHLHICHLMWKPGKCAGGGAESMSMSSIDPSSAQQSNSRVGRSVIPPRPRQYSWLMLPLLQL